MPAKKPLGKAPKQAPKKVQKKTPGKKSVSSKPTSSSKKTGVIEDIFNGFWPKKASQPISPMVVTNVQIQEAIARWNEKNKAKVRKPLSASNPANFLKDFIRKSSCNTNWPSRLKSLRITARQRYGNTQVFEFVQYRPGDSDPFPDRYLPKPGLPIIEIESLSIPRQARALGRVDEPWLIQVAVGQRIAQTHFAVESPLQFLDLTHLQMSVKTQPEIDAVYVATIIYKGEELRTLVTCEAKQFGERLLEDQLREQVGQAFATTSNLSGADTINAVLPISMQVLPNPNGVKEPRLIYFAEFKPITRKLFQKKIGADKLHRLPLVLQSSAYYSLKPDVRGISFDSI